MQQKPPKPESSKPYDSRTDTANIMNSKQSLLSLGYPANTNTNPHKTMLTSPPPPPPKQSETKDMVLQGMYFSWQNHFIINF